MHHLHCAHLTTTVRAFDLAVASVHDINVMRLCSAYILFSLKSFRKYISIFIVPSNYAFCCFACHIFIVNKWQMAVWTNQKEGHTVTWTFHESESNSWDWSRLLTNQWGWPRMNFGWLSVMSVRDIRDRAQSTGIHGTCGCTFWLNLCCFNFMFCWPRILVQSCK